MIIIPIPPFIFDFDDDDHRWEQQTAPTPMVKEILTFTPDEYDLEASQGCQPIGNAYQIEVASGTSPSDAKKLVNIDFKWRFFYRFINEKLYDKLNSLKATNQEYYDLSSKEMQLNKKLIEYGYIRAYRRSSSYGKNGSIEDQDKAIHELREVEREMEEKFEIPAIKEIIAENIDHPKVKQFLDARRNGEETTFHSHPSQYTVTAAADQYLKDLQSSNAPQTENESEM